MSGNTSVSEGGAAQQGIVGDFTRIGIPEIDEQHAYMVDLICKVEMEQHVERMRNYVMELLRYTREHFYSEENYMRQIRYPCLEEHKVIHDLLLRNVVEIAHEMGGLPNLSQEQVTRFRLFLRKWLVDHIREEDARIADFKNSSGSSAVSMHSLSSG